MDKERERECESERVLQMLVSTGERIFPLDIRPDPSLRASPPSHFYLLVIDLTFIMEVRSIMKTNHE